MDTEQDVDVAEEQITLDPDRVEAFNQRLASEQNLVLGIVGGVVAALIGAAVWATVTVLTGYQIGWMAIGVGFIVGYAVRILGKGLSTLYGIVGAVCALLGCALGNLLSICGFIAKEEGAGLMDVLLAILPNPAAVTELMVATFQPMDLLFYGIAVYGAYRAAFREITAADVAGLTAEAAPGNAGEPA